MSLNLYSYCRSSTAYRIRIALNLKKLDYTIHPVNLLKGEQLASPYLKVNPQGLVPTLVDGETSLTQSLAILDYLEARYAVPPLLPSDPVDRAQVLSLTLMIACEVHPLNNLRVLTYLTEDIDLSKDAKNRWYQHWIQQGFRPFEQRLQETSGLFCWKDQVTWADIALVPQIYNALRFNCDLTPYPILHRIYKHCIDMPEFDRAAPEQQIDFAL